MLSVFWMFLKLIVYFIQCATYLLICLFIQIIMFMYYKSYCFIIICDITLLSCCDKGLWFVKKSDKRAVWTWTRCRIILLAKIDGTWIKRRNRVAYGWDKSGKICTENETGTGAGTGAGVEREWNRNGSGTGTGVGRERELGFLLWMALHRMPVRLVML